MDINSLHENTIIAVAQKEQALAWMVTEGPLLEDPPLPMTALRALVADQRILRLRRGLYLAPRLDGRLPSLPRTLNLIDPDGYVSGHGALMLHGLNDQDIVAWYSVSPRRRGDIEYGQFRAHFVLSPDRAHAGSRVRIEVRGEPVTVATPARALIDEIDLMPLGLDLAETARVLRHALGSRVVSESGLITELGRTPSVATARRLGFLLEVVTGSRNATLLALAHSIGGITRRPGEDIPELTWRLYLSQARNEIARRSR